MAEASASSSGRRSSAVGAGIGSKFNEAEGLEDKNQW